MLNITVRIKAVDHDGFNGRDHHPGDEHIGKLVKIFRIRNIVFDEFMEFDYDPDNESQNHDEAMTVLDGQVVETGEWLVLVEHEVEAVGDVPVLFSK